MVFVMGLGVSAHALTSDNPLNATDNPYVTPGEAPVPKTGEAIGFIDLVDQVKQLIRVQDRAGHQLSFYADTTTPIYDSIRRQLAFEDLKAGDLISVIYSRDNYNVTEINKVKA